MGARSTGSHPTTTKADGHLIDYFRNTFLQGGGGNNVIVPTGLTATGGVISDYTDSGTVYRAHIFTSSGTFAVTAPGTFGDTVDCLVVAGGGGGGGANAAGPTGGYTGGGGAGGFRTGTSLPVSTSPGSYTVTIGAGGAGGS